MSKITGELVSTAEGLFYGHVDENEIFPFPNLAQEEKDILLSLGEAVSKYMEESIDPQKMDEESLIPEETYRELADMGLMGLGVPEEFGGMGLNVTQQCRMASLINYADCSIAAMLGAHQSIGYKALLLYGSDSQKKKYLSRLAKGEMLAAFCLTEPGAGSDAYSIKTKALDNGDGTFSVSGQKLWITNGGRADFYTVFCKTDHQLKGKSVEKITCFIVEKGAEGLSFGEKEKKMGIRASETRAVFFNKVRIPQENIIGELGKGFKIAMNVLNSGRLLLAGCSLGPMKYAFNLALKHATEREQFNQKLTSFGIIQDKLSRMAANYYMAESLVYYVTRRVDCGQKDYSLESAICKVFCSEKLWDMVDTSLQIAGGTGYMREYPYERLMRDTRINLIFEGTNEILRIFIALSGMRGPGETLKDVGRLANSVTKALLDPIKSVGILTNFAKGRFDKMRSKTFSHCHPRIEKHGENLSNMISQFAIEVENTLMKYTTRIIGNELPQKRIADMAIPLFTFLCMISRTTFILNNENVGEEEKDYITDLTDIGCKELHHSFMKAYGETSSNLDKQIQRVTKKVEADQGLGFDILNF